MMRPMIVERLLAGEDVASLRRSLAADSTLDRDELLSALSVVCEIAEGRQKELDALFVTLTFRDAVIAAIEGDESLSDLRRAVLLSEVRKRGELTADECRKIGQLLVDPSREDPTADVQGALALLEHGVELDPTDSRVAKWLAWALFANGRDEDAIKAHEAAALLAPEVLAPDYERDLRDLRKRIGQRGISPAGED